MGQRPKCKIKNYENLEENVGPNLQDIEVLNDFLDMTPKYRQQEKKTDKLDFMEFLNVCIKRYNQQSEKAITK